METEALLTGVRKLTLGRLNALAGVFQLLTGITLLVITDYDMRVPVYALYSTRKDGWQLDPRLLGHWPVGVWSGVFLLLSAANHVWVASVGNPEFEHNLSRKRNPVRWFEYTFSASLMHVMIAQLCGVVDIHLLITVFALTATCMLCGWLQELHDADWTPFIMGFWPWVAQWAVLFSFFARNDPPDFVYLIIFFQLALDSSFAAAMAWQRTHNYQAGEVVFIVLSLTSKQLLAWLNYGGTRSLPK